MKKYLLTAALALGISAPAMANEGRVEVRGGYTGILSISEPVIGAAVGYDFDLGGDAFLGAEASVDKVFNIAPIHEVVVGVTARGGFKIADKTKLYVNGGYSFGNGGSVHAGVGIQHKITDTIYAKVEHRRNFTDFGFDFDTTVIGFGINF